MPKQGLMLEEWERASAFQWRAWQKEHSIGTSNPCLRAVGPSSAKLYELVKGLRSRCLTNRVWHCSMPHHSSAGCRPILNQFNRVPCRDERLGHTCLTSWPAPSTGSKCMVSGSTPKQLSLPHYWVYLLHPLQAPWLNVITLITAIQMAMQPFMARLVAIEQSTPPRNKIENRNTTQEMGQSWTTCSRLGTTSDNKTDNPKWGM